jgi:hypothetical protein
MERRYWTIEEAATLLRIPASALRARCRRGQRRSGKDIVADLGDGIVAVKLGRSWRIRGLEGSSSQMGRS